MGAGWRPGDSDHRGAHRRPRRGPAVRHCRDDSAADLGESTDWVGLSAGEPERFVGGYWDEQVSLDPQWSINLENLPVGAVPGDTYPGDVFYRETDAGLCVVDVVWWTIESVG